MFGWTKKKSEFLDKAIRKANLEEQRIRTANAQCQPPTIAEDAFYRRQSVDRAPDGFAWETRTLIDIRTGESRKYKNINGEWVLVEKLENRIYGRDDNRL